MAVMLEDRPGGEVRVETGRGIVVELGPAGGRNRQVKFRATHQNLTELVTGWLDTEQQPAMADLVADAEAGRYEVTYRIEVRRKPGTDPTAPIADVPRRQKIRDLVMVSHGPAEPAARPVVDLGDVEHGLATVLEAILRLEARLAVMERYLRHVAGAG